MTAEFDEEGVARLRAALSRTVRELDRRSNDDRISRTQLTVLGTIARRRRVALGSLAELEGINPTMLSRIVGKLEEVGLVARVPDEVDRRATWVTITTRGDTVHAQNRAVRTKRLAELLTALPGHESEALLQAIPALEALAELTRRAR